MTTQFFVGFGVSVAVEIVYNCKDSSAEAFVAASYGVGIGSPGPTLNFGIGLNFIFNLATAKDYKGWFVAVNASAAIGVGITGTAFTTPTGLGNLLTTGGFGGETYGFGSGLVIGKRPKIDPLFASG